MQKIGNDVDISYRNTMNTNRKKACKTDNREKIGASIFGVHLIVSVIIILGSQRAAYCRMSDAYYERVFIHTDREYYIAGESVRFKGYLNSGDGSLVRSRILYVEILGTEGQSIGKQAFLLDENMVAGSVHLPDSLRSGTYFLRACTNWHKNLGNRYAFMKELLIVNRFGNNGKFAEEFPHGGEIITDPAKHDSHAIKLVDSAGSYFLVFKPVLIPQSGSVHCEIYSKGRRVYHEEITSWTEGSVLQVSREELPEGLLKILLREDDREQAVGYILNAHEPIRLNIKLDREVYEQRSPVSMKLELTGDTEIFEYGSISVSVSPVPDAFPQLNGMSITDWFNIYSEIANSFDPIKFYKPDSPIITGADRNWLFDEPELENNRYPIESYGHVIRGRVVEQRSGKAVSGAVVVFSFIDTIPYFDYDKTDHSGYFYINIPLGICADPGILQVWDTPEGTGICEIKLDGEDENYGFQWTGTERIGGEELTRLFSEQIAIFEIEKIFDEGIVQVLNYPPFMRDMPSPYIPPNL